MLLQSLGLEGPLKEGMATRSSILAWRIPWTEEPAGYSPWDRKELDMTEQLSLYFTDMILPDFRNKVTMEPIQKKVNVQVFLHNQNIRS